MRFGDTLAIACSALVLGCGAVALAGIGETLPACTACTATQCVNAGATTPPAPCNPRDDEVCCCCLVAGAWTCGCKTETACLNTTGCYNNP